MPKYIPFDKMTKLRESSRKGDERAKKIIKMQMNDEDFGSLLDEYFAEPTPQQPVQEMHNETPIQDERLKKFLDYNGVKQGDPDYDSTVEAYYQEFPKARPSEMKATNTEVDVELPDDEEEHSIYDEEDGVFESPTQHHVNGENDCLQRLIKEELDAIRSYGEAILEVMNCDNYSDNEKKGIIARLEEIKRDETEHFEELKRLVKKEESAIE